MADYRRIIPCLDVKDGRLVKGVHFVDLKDVGDPAEIGARYSAAGADEIEALKIGMEMETRGYKLYKEAAREAGTTEERKLLERLASEENQHYTMLQNTHTYLEHTGEWFIWEERGLLDGGES